MSAGIDTVVIGGGHNGLTAATVLARGGQRVALVERRTELGGLGGGREFASGYRSPGILHDSGALRPWVVGQLELEKYGVELRGEEIPVFIAQAGGEGRGLLLWRDPARASDEIEPSDADGYRHFRAFLDLIRPWIRGLLDNEPPDFFAPTKGDLWRLGRTALALRRLGKTDMMEVLRLLPMCTADWLSEWFESEILKAALAAPAFYASGLGPCAPGTNANLILADCVDGPGVRGGPQALVAGLEAAARAAGVEIVSGNGVRRVGIENGAATGVVLANGERLEAKSVAASCHPTHLFCDLVEPHLVPRRLLAHLRNFRCRGAAAKVHLALSELPAFACRPDLETARIRIGSSLQYLERASDAVKYRETADLPALDVRIPTLERPELAPPGHHVMSILAHTAPHGLEGGWNDERSRALLETVLCALERHLPDIRSAVVDSEVLSPADLESEFNLPGGHLLHGEPGLDQLLVRPTPECARYRTPFGGLYLCGSGSHPGGGITCAPGALAAKAMLKAS